MSLYSPNEKADFVNSGLYRWFARKKREGLGPYLEAFNALPAEGFEFANISRCRKRRAQTAKCYLSLLLEEGRPLFFYTFTLADEHLGKSEKWLREVLREGLKAVSPGGFMYNQDYGAENGRLHFHGLGFANPEEVKEMWPYGFVDARKVCLSGNSPKAVAAYIVKITNHGVKPEAFFKRCYYYRKPFKED